MAKKQRDPSINVLSLKKDPFPALLMPKASEAAPLADDSGSATEISENSHAASSLGLVLKIKALDDKFLLQGQPATADFGCVCKGGQMSASRRAAEVLQNGGATSSLGLVFKLTKR